MSIKTSVNLRIDVKKSEVICYDIPTLQLLLGSTAVSGNYKLYGIVKRLNTFVISKSNLIDRIDTLRERRDKLNKSIDIMQQVLK